MIVKLSLIFEKTYLKHLQICLVRDGQAIVRQTPRLSRWTHPWHFRKHVTVRCVKCPGIAPGYANAQSLGRDKIGNAPLQGLTMYDVNRAAWGGGWALLIHNYMNSSSFFSRNHFAGWPLVHFKKLSTLFVVQPGTRHRLQNLAYRLFTDEYIINGAYLFWLN